jgi:hypothetical protein
VQNTAVLFVLYFESSVIELLSCNVSDMELHRQNLKKRCRLCGQSASILYRLQPFQSILLKAVQIDILQDVCEVSYLFHELC